MQQSFVLIPFPDRPHPEIAITGECHIQQQQLTLSYRVYGDLQSIVMPAQTIAGQANELWKHTCFECFLQLANQKHYIELNFSPNGQWAIYAFDDYRIPAQSYDAISLVSMQTDKLNDEYLLEVVIDFNQLAIKNIGLSAVVEADKLSYWALIHKQDEPDFHCQESFIINL
jgi:hypothetical protein